MSYAIALDGLEYRAGKSFEIRDLAMRVPSGSIYGFLGANGAGKSTTLRMIMGLLRARGGSIKVLGEEMPARSPSILARVGYVPERPHVYPQLTVGQAMELHAAFFTPQAPVHFDPGGVTAAVARG